MKILFINSVQTSLLTPLQCGEGKNDGVCGFKNGDKFEAK